VYSRAGVEIRTTLSLAVRRWNGGMMGIAVWGENSPGLAACFPGLKSETWATHSFFDGQAWVTRFKPDEVVGTADDCHPVTFGIADADFGSHGHEMNLIKV